MKHARTLLKLKEFFFSFFFFVLQSNHIFDSFDMLKNAAKFVQKFKAGENLRVMWLHCNPRFHRLVRKPYDINFRPILEFSAKFGEFFQHVKASIIKN